MELEEKKSRLIEFGRFAEDNCKRQGKKPETFDFLGFTHYCSKSRNGKFRVKRKTSKKKFAKKCKEVHRWIGRMRTMELAEIIKKLNQMLVGYYHYYGITDNSQKISDFRFRVTKSLFFWLNRRSQKYSYTWEEFSKMLKMYPLAQPRIYVSVYVR
ncbi:MAG: RNA-directed DNA polymerase [Lachnospiraceae bacterium]|nr:RNA-directed DNA polymerase [Lachnospiraceae bacterium]